mgnify:CR=1 FL=1
MAQTDNPFLDGMAKAVMMAIPTIVFLTLPNRNADLAFVIKLSLLLWSVNTMFMFQGVAAGLLEQRARERGQGEVEGGHHRLPACAARSSH